MAKLTKIVVYKVTLAGKTLFGYYRDKANAEKDAGKTGKVEPVELYRDEETDKIYVLQLAGSNGHFKD